MANPFLKEKNWRARRFAAFLFCTRATYNMDRSSRCSVVVRRYTLSNQETTEGNTLNAPCRKVRWNYLSVKILPNYFLCFFADFFFSSRTSFWTRFNIGCAHIVRSIMPFEGWATRFLTFGFLTLDFLGAIFFWYFSLRKKNRKYQDNAPIIFAK